MYKTITIYLGIGQTPGQSLNTIFLIEGGVAAREFGRPCGRTHGHLLKADTRKGSKII